MKAAWGPSGTLPSSLLSIRVLTISVLVVQCKERQHHRDQDLHYHPTDYKLEVLIHVIISPVSPQFFHDQHTLRMII